MSGKIHKMILESWKKFKNFKFERNSIWICFTQLVQIARTAVASNYSENSFISTLSELFCCWTKSRTQKNIWVKYKDNFNLLYCERERVVYFFYVVILFIFPPGIFDFVVVVLTDLCHWIYPYFLPRYPVQVETFTFFQTFNWFSFRSSRLRFHLLNIRLNRYFKKSSKIEKIEKFIKKCKLGDWWVNHFFQKILSFSTLGLCFTSSVKI